VVERLYGELEIAVSSKTPLFATEAGEFPPLTGGLYWKSFCVTGSFDILSRDQIHELIEGHGGEVRTSVSVKLDYLIAGDNAGSKRSKALECGVQIISLIDFQNLID